MNKSKHQEDAIAMLSSKSEELITRYPRLKELKDEIEWILSNTKGAKNRQEVLDIMYKATRDELHNQLHHLNKILESTDSKCVSLKHGNL